MCGISGIISKRNQSIDSNQIKAINDIILHRGPDGEGFYYGSNFALAHRRLAIIDLSTNASQPMNWQDKYVITFNGEVFNYIEIREELLREGYNFKSSSDTEVILAAYDKWGSDCVKRFNGMWSFALFDQKNNTLFCSRDRFGIKPFYFVENAECFAFGSEIKQLLTFLPQIRANRQLVLEYLITAEEEVTNQTFFNGVTKLEQGHNMTYDLTTHHYTIEKYYELNLDDSNSLLCENEAIEKYRKQLDDAVRLRMRSDVQVASCLSGGLDSSTITALASQINLESTGKGIHAIHARANEKKLDESNFAQLVASHTNTEMHIIEPSYQEFKDHIDEVIKVQEEPFGSPSILLQYLLLKEARERNYIVMLDGQGGDETLLGYPRYYPAFLKSQKGLSKIKGFLNSSENSSLSRLDLLKFYFYFTNYRIRLNYLKKRNRFIKREYLDAFESKVLKEISTSYTDINKLQMLEIRKTQLPHLLKYEDKNSTANSVETRLPFLDYRCVELALSLPNQYKIKEGWTKYILRKSIDSILPKEIVWRKSKLGFAAPETTWLTAHQQIMEDVILTSAILKEVIDFSQMKFDKLDLRTKWRLFNVAKWEQQFNVVW